MHDPGVRPQWLIKVWGGPGCLHLKHTPHWNLGILVKLILEEVLAISSELEAWFPAWPDRIWEGREALFSPDLMLPSPCLKVHSRSAPPAHIPLLLTSGTGDHYLWGRSKHKMSNRTNWETEVRVRNVKYMIGTGEVGEGRVSGAGDVRSFCAPVPKTRS